MVFSFVSWKYACTPNKTALEKIKNKLTMEIHAKSNDRVEFDII